MNFLIAQNRYTTFVILFILVNTLSCNNKMPKEPEITKSEIRLTNEGYRIFLNDEPFYVDGAGVGKGDLETLASHGANSFRTWSTQNAKEILDKAQKLDLKVMMGIWVGLERQGFDYNDQKAVKTQLDRIRQEVLAYKDHPALMSWAIGNELNLSSKNPKVWDAVNEISEMIHELDPNHLTTTPLAGIDKKYVDLIAKRAPDLDFLSVQLYAGIENLPELIEQSNYQGGLMVTEWGATGYWEVDKTSWGAPIENNSSVKADLYKNRYIKFIKTNKQIMGSYVFLWGQKQERTPTWFGMLMADGNETESVDVMHYLWTGKWPENRSPRLIDFTLEGKRAIDNIKLKKNKTYTTKVSVKDPDGDKLNYRWEIMRESQSQKSGGDKEKIPETIDGYFSTDNHTTTFKAPSDSGAYRLFIYVEDGHQHTAHANIPFLVE
ncbi:glycoside hydrolase family 2 TIM barrel-domain containing protein [Mesohalobacter halotolerans]|uniref:Glycoside hydrolase family 5 domain-containing protein n=1 Tax=Mesohalobacter halotolerans TaxID=1883405 RepID=A0A4U5TQM5_9FLAO|nr:glycoside hydrolase family 2 TIM barrel-domain containing protein [Mesohalobacter halotolerans]TKS56212.1 hypothetical protein FCN74_09385 [Mesohalobacter halotolerans]